MECSHLFFFLKTSFKDFKEIMMRLELPIKGVGVEILFK